MFSNKENTTAFFYRVTAKPRTVLSIAVLLIVALAAGIGQLVKDTSVKAFIPPDDPVLLADEKATEIFGLSDTIAVALSTTGETVFEPATLATIAELTDRIADLPNVRPDRLVSLATESAISGKDGKINVDPYVGEPPITAIDAQRARESWRAMPPHRGTLVSEDESSAIILVEIVDSALADETYEGILAAVSSSETSGLDVKVAGPGAVSGYLSKSIDQDARKLQPLVFILVLGFIYLAFRRIGALPGPLLVVIGAAGGALGLMAWRGEPYYAITNALPVVIVAISVADAIHVLSAYFQYRAQQPDTNVRDLVVKAMSTMARPITLTTLTTVAGFAGISAVSIMPPITAFGWYAALGVILAWLFSLFALPNMLVLMKLGPSAAFDNWRNNRPSGVGRFLAHIGAFSARRYPQVLAAFVIVSAVAVAGAMQLRVDRSQVDNFAPAEEIRIADEFINRTFSGTAFLDIIVESNVDEGLLDAERMRRIVALQEYLEELPHVQKSISITDYLSLLHHAVEEHDVDVLAERQLPESEDGIAQYLFLYEISGDPTDFEEEIDYDYRTALIRGILDTHYFSQSREAVESLQRFIDTEFNSDDLTATLAGDVTIGYQWMSRLEQSHFLGVVLSLVLVLATSMLVFRSVTAGIIAVVPVSFAVLALYAVMGYAGIYLEPATSMFAAIALGVGVDFGIHLVERLRSAQTTHAGDTVAIVDNALPATARACFFNSAALALGFSVLMASNLPTLQRFGGLVTLAAVSSYFAALIIVPALYAAERAVSRRLARSTRRLATRSVVASMIVVGALFFLSRADAADAKGMEIARKIADRPEGKATQRSIDITLTNKRGKTRTQSALVLRETTEIARYTRITYVEPKRIRNTSLLSHDYHADEKADLNWAYAPVLGRPRSLPPGERGDYFGGTDFTNEDMQSELKFDLSDYVFDYLGANATNGRMQHRITGTPVNREIAKQLGYGKLEATVDEQTWIPVHIEFFDVRDELLKTVSVTEIHDIEGLWTATVISVSNHQTGHSTELRLSDVEYVDDLDDGIFQPASLARRLQIASVGDSR